MRCHKNNIGIFHRQGKTEENTIIKRRKMDGNKKLCGEL